MTDKAYAIGQTFVALLRKELSTEDWLELLRRNASTPYREGSCCASHDFTDANEVMADAMRTHGIDPDPANDAAAAVWSAAWAAAMPQLTAARGEDILRCLQDLGIAGTWEYPGYIALPTPTGGWDIGTANGPWGGNFIEGPTGECTASFELTGSELETDAAAIARRIVFAMIEQCSNGCWALTGQLDARDIVSRALSVILESEGRDEHGELIGELRALLGHF